MTKNRTIRTVLGLALALLTVAIAATSATAHGKDSKLVVRGDATVVDAPCGGPVCALELTGGHFRGTVGTGDYSGSLKLLVAEGFPNGEGGVCAPIEGKLVLGLGTPDRLVLAIDGDSCQDGAGDPRTASFTNVARFTVKHGTGTYAKAHGSGVMTSTEGADDLDHMTLVGRISR